MPIDQNAEAPGLRSHDVVCLSSQDLGSRPVFEAMTLIHDKKILLCRDLENIADSLPASADKPDCLAVASILLPLLRRAHAFEEKTVFPVYDALVTVSVNPGSPNHGSTDRLRAEHISDECFASDLTEILLKVGHGEKITDAETLGFMLRGFFEGLRRHVAFENEHIAPIIKAMCVSHRNAV